MIDWAAKTEVRDLLPKDLSPKILEKLPTMPGHVWMATSGTMGSRRLVALSRDAIMASAISVNQHLDVQKEDRWFNCLPDVHIGGLSIYARAHQGGNHVSTWDYKWNVEKFFDALSESKATLLSLVPTQLYDLVKWNKPCPDHVRAIIVGGGALRDIQYSRARQLGYPILPSYGLTECCSQVATASLDSLNQEYNPELHVLTHVEAKNDVNGVLHIRSGALLSGYVEVPDRDFMSVKFVDPRKDGWYDTDDTVDMGDNVIKKVMGRRTDVLKVSGELVHVGFLQHMWDSSSGGVPGVVLGVPDSRREHNIVLVLTSGAYKRLRASIAIFEENIASVTTLSGVYYVDEIPKSELGKTKNADLTKLLGF